MIVEYEGFECNDGSNNHYLEQVEDARADWTCSDCGLNVYGEPASTTVGTEID